jgi:hypothetical protein
MQSFAQTLKPVAALDFNKPIVSEAFKKFASFNL